jgi:hypothetical protein
LQGKEGEIGRAYSMHGGERNTYRILLGKPDGKRPLERHRIDGRIILRWVLRNRMGWYGLD